MPSRNPITGDLQQSKPLSEQGRENHEKVFGSKGVQKGSWVYRDGKLVPKTSTTRRRGVDIFVDNMEAYDSPISGKHITNRQERDRDLKENGCRPYEGRESETREANNYKTAKENKLYGSMRETLEYAHHDQEHGHHNITKKV